VEQYKVDRSLIRLIQVDDKVAKHRFDHESINFCGFSTRPRGWRREQFSSKHTIPSRTSP